MSLILISSLLLISAGAPAERAATQEVPAAAQDESNPKQSVICRRSPVAGSRMARRVCMTAQQWQDADAEAQNQKNSTQENATRNGREDWLGPRPI